MFVYRVEVGIGGDNMPAAWRHVIVGQSFIIGSGTYTILLTGKETADRYCLIDMHVPRCVGPGPHRHDFEEMFTILKGAIEVTFRGKKTLVRACKPLKLAVVSYSTISVKSNEAS